MSESRRVLALSAFHTLLAASVVVLPVGALVAYAGSTIHPLIGLALLAYLALVTWWATRRAISELPKSPRSLVDAYITAGVRWGSIGGALYAGGILVLPFLLATGVTLFGSDTGEYNLVGAQWAFVWMAAIPFFASIFLGTILGRDRHHRPHPPRDRTVDPRPYQLSIARRNFRCLTGAEPSSSPSSTHCSQRWFWLPCTACF